MTTLCYLRYPALSPEDAILDARFGAALSAKDSRPDWSNQVLRELASAGGYAAAGSHMELAQRHRFGDSLPRSGAKALEHVMAAIGLGDTAAMCFLASEYGRQSNPDLDPDKDPGGLDLFGEQLVSFDRNHALSWYRKAAQLGHRSAWLPLAEVLRQGRPARECSAEELAEIETAYANAGEFYFLADMYCPGEDRSRCSAAEIATAKRWHCMGRDAGIDACARVLNAWS